MSRKHNGSDICTYEGINPPQQVGTDPWLTVGKMHNLHEDM